MKKFLFGIGLILLACIPIIADDQLARAALAQVTSGEPAPDSDAWAAEKTESRIHDAPFREKYGWSLKSRYYILRYAFFMGNYKFCKELAKETLERYKDSALDGDRRCQDILFFEARAWEESDEYQYKNARIDYLLVAQTYPDNPHAPEAKRRYDALDLLVKTSLGSPNP